jgi:tRNA threonylcarbamoyladenosine biosynthesis protein TsaE
MSVSISLSELDLFTKKFSAVLLPGTVVLLVGEMGAGKTTFVSSLASHFHATSVCSPTFTIVNRYEGDIPINHLDLYRLTSEDGLYSIDIDRYLSDKDAITFIEWPEKLGALLPSAYIKLTFKYCSEDIRELVISSTDPALNLTGLD